MTIRELARAKVNLTLTVRGRRSDGYHDLESLVTFAEVNDTLTLTPRPDDGLVVTGPFAQSIVGENLLTRAVALLRAMDPGLRLGAVHLEKRLPVAAGLGGGSADAAALLRAARRANPDRADAMPWLEIAGRLGADVPMCLDSRPAVASGKGDRLAPLTQLPALHAVLVNPRRPLATASVFAAFTGSTPSPAPRHPARSAFVDLDGLLDYVRAHGNDLEPAAVALLPAIGEVKTCLKAQAGCLYSAMSGSGPTCFGIFATGEGARRAAAAIAAGKPDWWTEPTILGGIPPSAEPTEPGQTRAAP
jgi:4-diphosphocytidyl-2-C-methyl-D-erythritol kinase